jgi:DNA repair photolyase
LTIEFLEGQLKKSKFPDGEYVLLSFQGDPYCHAEEKYLWTRRILELFLEYQVPTAILTKGGARCLRDLDLFKKFENIKVGATLTFFHKEDSKKYEPGASLPFERLDTLATLHHEGIRTWASFEPVIDPDQTLELMTLADNCADEYKIGKINHEKELESRVDWAYFGGNAENICIALGKKYYIKADLRKAMEARS